MALEDIDSPPYPTEGITPDGLYNSLKELRKWVNKYRPAHNKAIGQDIIPTVREFPDRKAYIVQPVVTQFTHFISLRRFREAWDHLIRNYETEWDHPMCLRQRANLLQQAALLLNGAFTPFEHVEARRQKELERLQQHFTQLNDVLSKFMESQYHDPNSEEEGEAAD